MYFKWTAVPDVVWFMGAWIYFTFRCWRSTSSSTPVILYGLRDLTGSFARWRGKNVPSCLYCSFLLVWAYLLLFHLVRLLYKILLPHRSRSYFHHKDLITSLCYHQLCWTPLHFQWLLLLLATSIFWKVKLSQNNAISLICFVQKFQALLYSAAMTGEVFKFWYIQFYRFCSFEIAFVLLLIFVFPNPIILEFNLPVLLC